MSDEGQDQGAQTIDPAQFAALQEEKEALLAKNKELLQARADTRKEADKAAEALAKKSGDWDAFEASLKEKHGNELGERDSKISEYQQMINKMTVGSQASKLAASMALPGSADVLLPHIERRLEVEMKDGAAIVRVLDKDGKPSALSVEDLQKDIEGNAAFAPLLLGSKASGSGGVGGKGNPTAKTMPRSEFNNLGPQAMMDYIKSGGVPVD